MNDKSSRFYGLDSVRGFAVLLGLVLHSAIPYMHWPLPTWPVRDESPIIVFDFAVYYIHSFRMQLFFVLAGYFCILLCRKIGLRNFFKNRFKKIFIPFIFSLFMLQPVIQFLSYYFEFNEQLAVYQNRIPKVLFRTYFFPMGDFHQTDPMKGLRDYFYSFDWVWNIQPMYLWFLYYLLIFYAVYFVLESEASGHNMLKKISHFKIGNCELYLMGVTFLTLIFMREWGVDSFSGWSLSLRGLLYYFSFFLFGIIIYLKNIDMELWSIHWRRYLVFGNLVFLPLAAGLTVYGAPMELGGSLLPKYFYFLKTFAIFCYSVVSFFNVKGLIGFFLCHFKKYDPKIDVLSEASYWIYLVSLPLILFLQGLVSSLNYPGMIKFALVLTVSTSISLGMFVLFVKNTVLSDYIGRKRS